MLFILHEYVVTDLSVLATVTSRAAVRTAIRNVLNIEHLAVRSTWAIFKSPPVVLCWKIENVLRLKSRLDTVFSALFISWSILITCKNSCCKVISIKSKKLCQKLKAPLATLFFKIVTK